MNPSRLFILRLVATSLLMVAILLGRGGGITLAGRTDHGNENTSTPHQPSPGSGQKPGPNR